MKSKLVLLALLLASTSEAATIATISGGLSNTGIEVKIKGVKFTAQDKAGEINHNKIRPVIDINALYTFSNDQAKLAFGVNIGVMMHFGEHGFENRNMNINIGGRITSTSISLRTEALKLLYVGPTATYQFNEKISAGLSANYTVSMVGTIEKTYITHGVMPSLFVSYAFSETISARLSFGYVFFFNNKESEAKIGETELDHMHHTNAFVATAGVSFKQSAQ